MDYLLVGLSALVLIQTGISLFCILTTRALQNKVIGMNNAINVHAAELDKLCYSNNLCLINGWVKPINIFSPALPARSSDAVDELQRAVLFEQSRQFAKAHGIDKDLMLYAIDSVNKINNLVYNNLLLTGHSGLDKSVTIDVMRPYITAVAFITGRSIPVGLFIDGSDENQVIVSSALIRELALRSEMTTIRKDAYYNSYAPLDDNPILDKYENNPKLSRILNKILIDYMEAVRSNEYAEPKVLAPAFIKRSAENSIIVDDDIVLIYMATITAFSWMSDTPIPRMMVHGGKLAIQIANKLHSDANTLSVVGMNP